MVKVYALNIILLQQTMWNGDKAKEVLTPILKNGFFYSLDSNGFFEGILMEWIPWPKSISFSLIPYVIHIELEIWNISSSFHFINLYGPNIEKKTYWKGLQDSWIFSGNNMIIGGDIKLNISPYELCRDHPHRDPMEGFFSHFFESSHLVDLELAKILPT